MAIREWNRWHRSTPDFDIKLALFRYGKRIFDRIRSKMLECPKHLIMGLEIKLSWLIAHPLWVANGCGCLNTQQNIVCTGIRCTEIVGIICCYERNIQRPCGPNDFLIDFLLTLCSVALNFEVKVISKHFPVPGSDTFCLFVSLLLDDGLR